MHDKIVKVLYALGKMHVEDDIDTVFLAPVKDTIEKRETILMVLKRSCLEIAVIDDKADTVRAKAGDFYDILFAEIGQEVLELNIKTPQKYLSAGCIDNAVSAYPEKTGGVSFYKWRRTADEECSKKYYD